MRSNWVCPEPPALLIWWQCQRSPTSHVMPDAPHLTPAPEALALAIAERGGRGNRERLGSCACEQSLSSPAAGHSLRRSDQWVLTVLSQGFCCQAQGPRCCQVKAGLARQQSAPENDKTLARSTTTASAVTPHCAHSRGGLPNSGNESTEFLACRDNCRSCLWVPQPARRGLCTIVPQK